MELHLCFSCMSSQRGQGQLFRHLTTLPKNSFNKIFHSAPRYRLVFCYDDFTHTHTHTHTHKLTLLTPDTDVQPVSPLLLKCTLSNFLQSVVTVSLLRPGIFISIISLVQIHQLDQNVWKDGSGRTEGIQGGAVVLSAANIKTVAFFMWDIPVCGEYKT
jgi:hypothetical protein